MLSDKIKNIIFEYLLDEIYKVEIIYYRDSIWFIDRENRYWYFEYHKVDKHLWWRWSHFTTALTMFSMEAEKEQYLLGELVNMILTKKQKLEEKYPNKIFKTVGSVMNFGDKVEEVLNSEIDTTRSMEYQNINRMDEALNCEVKTAYGTNLNENVQMKEVLNCEVNTTQSAFFGDTNNVIEDVLNNEVETTDNVGSQFWREADAVISFEVETTGRRSYFIPRLVDEVLNCEVNTTQSAFFGDTNNVIEDVLNFDVKTTDHNQPFTNELIDKVLVDKVLEIETIGYSKTHRARPVTGALDYNDNPVEIKSIEKLKGENPFQDIIVSHILDESDKVTDKLKMKEDDYVKTYSHDVYMCDHLVQNVLDIGVNSIHYDAESHTPLIDGILKKA